MRVIILRGLLFVILVGLAACGQQTSETETPFLVEEAGTVEASATEPETGEEEPVVALVMKTLTNPFFVEMERGAREAEAEFEVDLLVRTGAQETSIEQQIAIVTELIEDDVAAIVIAPADSEGLVPVLKKAQDAGIEIVNIDNQLDPEVSATLGLEDVPFISVDNEYGAYLSAKYISDQIETPAKVAILEGIRAAKNAQARKQGSLRAFEENENIVSVVMETANWKIDEAYTVTEQLFAEHPDIKAIFSSNDMMAFGVLRYLEETGRSDEVLVSSYDALTEAVLAVQEGRLEATIDQQAALQGYMGVQYAVWAMQGTVLSSTVLVDVKLVTLEKVE